MDDDDQVAPQPPAPTKSGCSFGWLIAIVAVIGGYLAFCTGDPAGPTPGTVTACQRFRVIQADPPSDIEVVSRMLRILELGDLSGSVRNAADDLADALESGTSTDVQAAIVAFDAGCDIHDL